MKTIQLTDNIANRCFTVEHPSGEKSFCLREQADGKQELTIDGRTTSFCVDLANSTIRFAMFKNDMVEHGDSKVSGFTNDSAIYLPFEVAIPVVNALIEKLQLIKREII